MDRKIRVGAVSYLNTLPLIDGFKKGLLQNEMDLIEAYPAHLAGMLMGDEIDVGLVPVAVMPKLKEAHIISKYCIGASSPVCSVCLFSDVPIEEVKEVLVDYQSRTSAALLKILLQKYWKQHPLLIDAQSGYEEKFGGHTAALIIGDRALQQRQRNNYIYDLAEAWMQMTSLPFVFAAWVANKQLPETFITQFDEATGLGLQHIDDIVKANPCPYYDLHTYFTKNIDYRLDAKKLEGLNLFLEML